MRAETDRYRCLQNKWPARHISLVGVEFAGRLGLAERRRAEAGRRGLEGPRGLEDLRQGFSHVLEISNKYNNSFR